MNKAQLLYEINKDLFDPNVIKKLVAIENQTDREIACSRYFEEVMADRHDARTEQTNAQIQAMTQAIDEARATIREALQRLAPVMIEDVRQGCQDWDELRAMLEDHPEVREEVENYL